MKRKQPLNKISVRVFIILNGFGLRTSDFGRVINNLILKIAYIEIPRYIIVSSSKEPIYDFQQQ
jgi:hypothetical protein